MAITIWGVDPSITETEWAVLLEIAAKGAWSETVSENGGQLAPAAGGGTRQVTIAAGDCVAAGVLGRNSASVTVTHDANATSVNRYDYVIFKFNWAGTNATGGTIEVKKGSTSSQTPPALVRTAGTTWELPLALVTIIPSVSAIPAGSVADVRPRYRRTIRYAAHPAGGQSMGNGVTTPSNIALINVPDPGWPYLLRVSAQVKFDELTNGGFGRLEFNIDGGAQEAESRAPENNRGVAQISYVTAPKTGPLTARLNMVPAGMAGGGDPLTTGNAYGQFIVEVVPA